MTKRIRIYVELGSEAVEEHVELPDNWGEMDDTSQHRWAIEQVQECVQNSINSGYRLEED